MKKTFTTLFIFISIVCLGQKQNNNWCFGYHCGVSFNSGSPVSFSGSSTNSTSLEGVSAMSDVNGNLLFYTDGTTVWNKTNVAMPNGTGLLGNYSTSEGALIVPQPGSNSIYYVFTIDQDNGSNGLHYSVVDMTLAGGMGDVSQLNIALQGGTLYTEKMIGIFDSSGTNVWVITHKSYSNTFHSYHVTSAGINTTPVISNVGQTYADYDAVGTMHCTLDGSRIAVSYWNDLKGYEVFDFDKGSGQLSNPLFITSTNYLWAYSVCFSPDGRYLYGGCFNSNNIFQFDLHLALPVGVLITTPVDFVGDMQLGPDSIIYVSLDDNPYLSAIKKPDSSGVGCDFVTNAVYLGGTPMCALGLNNYIYPAGHSVAPPVANFMSDKTAICANDCINFTDLSSNATSWRWYFEGALDSTSTSQNPQTVCYATEGTYNITLIAANAGGNDSITFTRYINVRAVPPTPTISQVDDTLLYCSTDSSYFSYQWYNDTNLIAGATDTVLVVKQSGDYNVQVSNRNGCSIAVGINIILGIQHYNSNDILTLFPDPATDLLSIYISSVRNEALTFSVMNVLGQVVLSPAPPERNGANAIVDVSRLSPGIYFLQLKWKNGSVEKRFVKE